MVVADEDPPRKRSRLSLKSKKGDNAPPADDPDPPPLESAGTVPQDPLLSSEQEVTDCSPPVIDLTESDLPSDGPRVPPVASMENLGNTCFLNSVLEVLRYTPCFLEGLEELYRHIVYLEKVKTNDAVLDSEEVKTDRSLAWDLVKNMFKMYKRMEKREETFSQFANADVTSMAVKPDIVLDVIREFNPMFEGNMQHDAQELLRCLLCYLEDAERELHGDYAAILALDPSLLKTPGPTPSSQDTDRQNSGAVMDKFLSGGKTKSRRGKPAAVSALKFEQSPTDSPLLSTSVNGLAEPTADCESVSLKRANPVTKEGGDMLDSIEEKDEERHPQSEEVAESRPKKRRFRQCRLKEEEEKLDEVDGADKGSQVKGLPNTSLSEAAEQRMEKAEEVSGRPGRKVSSLTGDKNGRTCPASGSQGATKHARTRQSRVKTAKASKKMEGSPEDDAPKDAEMSTTESGLVNGIDGEGQLDRDKSQPTILSMFGKKSRQCRRLGMRGRVVHCEKNEDSPPQPTLSPINVDISPEPRRSPRKANNARPVAVAVPSRKHNGVVTPSTSPARPDEFPAHAVGKSCSATFTPSTPESGRKCFTKSPMTAQLWDLNGLTLPKVDEVGKCNGLPSPLEMPKSAEEDFGFGEQDFFNDQLPDLDPAADLENGLSRFSLKQEKVSPGQPRLTAKVSPSTTKSSGNSSSLTPSSLLSPRSEGRETKGPKCQPSKLMIKLEKCDHLCGTPTISAAAAMKALKGASANTCRQITYGGRELDDFNKEQDSDEDEVSLGTRSSFKSVPLKSVCVKVEKCDMVCNSPEKSVSARFATSCLARQRAQRFNMIEKLFQGAMMMRTKCLECERCTERRESFQDVSVPLKAEGSVDSDSEPDEEKDSSLLCLMRAFTDVERLREDNKYYCEQCFRYVEAERSLHYDSLPNILTVHLKRFSATGMFGCLSKINDYVTVPLLLSCLRYKCPKPCVRPDHRYTLYAIITHAGSTISAGHYLSYIKVRPNAVGHDTLSNYLSDSPEKKNDSSLRQGNLPSPSVLTPQSPLTPNTAESVPEKTSSGECLDRLKLNSVSGAGDAAGIFTDSPQAGGKSVNTRLTPERLSYTGDSPGKGREGGQEGREADMAEYHWLECDDETIRILSEKEFHGRLTEKDGALRGTPYVLFYHRLDTWRAK